VIKLDLQLNIQWAFVYSTYGDYNEKAFSIIEVSPTLGSGYAVIGWTEYAGINPSPAIFIMKLTPLGQQQWVKIYNHRHFGEMGWITAPTEGYDIVELPVCSPYLLTGGYAVTGRGFNLMMQNWDAIVMCVDPAGNIIMPLCKAINGSYDDEGYSLIVDNFNLVVAGWTNSYGLQPPPPTRKANIFVWSMPLNIPGGPDIFNKAYGWLDEDEKVMDEQSLVKTVEGHYAISGWTKSVGPGTGGLSPNPNFLIMKFDNMGNIIWSRVHPSIPGANSEEAYPIIQTFSAGIPSGYAIAGWTNSFGIGQSEDFHFLTVDQNGARPICVLDLIPGTEPCYSYMDSAVVFTEGFDVTTILLKDTSVMYTKVCTTETQVDTIDVGPTKIFFSAASPFDSTNTTLITPSCSLYNYGNADVSNYNVQMTIGNFYTGTYMVGSHQSHTYIQADFPTSVTDWPRGQHTVKCTTQLTGDVDDTNDTLSSSIFVNVHDVGTVEINHPTGNVDSLATFTPKVKIKNFGNVSENFNVKFTIDGPAKTTWTDDSIVTVSAGNELTIDFASWTVGPSGNYTTKCTTELSTDMDGSNDKQDSTFTVVGTLSHNVGTMEIITPISGDIDSVAIITPKARVKNYGSNSETFNVKFTIEGPAKATWTDDTTVSLNSLEELTIEFEDWTVGACGNYTAKCSTELSGDEFYDNDKKEISFAIVVAPPSTPGWAMLESIPVSIDAARLAKAIKDGGAITGVPGEGKEATQLFAFTGTKTPYFLKYTVGTGWTYNPNDSMLFGNKYKPGPPPVIDTIKFNKKYPGKGAALCFDGDHTIYATKGNGTFEFFAYDLLTGVWTPKAFAPSLKGLKGGTSLCWYDGKVYMLAGAQKKDNPNNFFAYDPLTDAWTTLAGVTVGINTKPWKDGSSINVLDGMIYAVKGGDKYNAFYVYDPIALTWTEKEEIPVGDSLDHKWKKVLVKDGAVSVVGEGVIYAMKGGAQTALWKYTPGVTGVWENLDPMPIEKVDKKHRAKTGAAATYVDGAMYMLVGNKMPEFWRYAEPVKTANVRPATITSAAGEKTTTIYNFNLSVSANPFRKTTTINYTVPVNGKVKIKLFNASGRLVETLVNDNLSAGKYTINLSANKLSSGVYFVKYESNTNNSELKLIVQ